MKERALWFLFGLLFVAWALAAVAAETSLTLEWEGLTGAPFAVGRCTKSTTTCTTIATVQTPAYTIPPLQYGAACYRLRPAGGVWSEQLCATVSKPGSANTWSAAVTVPK